MMHSRAPPLLCSGALATAVSIARHEGVAGLYAGLPPALLRHVFYSGTRITVYEQLKPMLERRAAASANHASSNGKAASSNGSAAGSGGLQLASKLAAGLMAGVLGQLVAVPADLVKVGF